MAHVDVAAFPDFFAGGGVNPCCAVSAEMHVQSVCLQDWRGRGVVIERVAQFLWGVVFEGEEVVDDKDEESGNGSMKEIGKQGEFTLLSFDNISY